MTSLKPTLYISPGAKKSMLDTSSKYDPTTVMSVLNTLLLEKGLIDETHVSTLPQRTKGEIDSKGYKDVTQRVNHIYDTITDIFAQDKPFFKSFMEVIYFLISEAEIIGKIYNLPGKDKKNIVMSIVSMTIKNNKTQFKILGIKVPLFMTKKLSNKMVLYIVSYLIDFIIDLYNAAKIKLAGKSSNKQSK